jgi:hypothetical protein
MATQYSGDPFPEPIRVSVGLIISSLSGNRTIKLDRKTTTKITRNPPQSEWRENPILHVNTDNNEIYTILYSRSVDFLNCEGSTRAFSAGSRICSSRVGLEVDWEGEHLKIKKDHSNGIGTCSSRETHMF